MVESRDDTEEKAQNPGILFASMGCCTQRKMSRIKAAAPLFCMHAAKKLAPFSIVGKSNLDEYHFNQSQGCLLFV